MTFIRRHSYHPHTMAGLRLKACALASSMGSNRRQSPVSGSRKVGTPLSAETPAPVSTTIRSAAFSASAASSRVVMVSSAVQGVLQMMPHCRLDTVGAWIGNRLKRVANRAETKKPLSFRSRAFDMAQWTGLEPATPGVTGRYSNRLNYHCASAGLASESQGCPALHLAITL